MKTTILLMFSFIFITGSLFGQKDTTNYIDSDIRKQFFPVTNPDSSRFIKPLFNSPKKPDSSTLRDLDRFELYQDSGSIKYDTVKLSSEYIVAEESPRASGFYAKRPYPISSHNDKSFVIKPNNGTCSSFYLKNSPLIWLDKSCS